MEQAIILGNGRLKCDACDYIGETMTRDLAKCDIGTPCPKCGADMLTERDFSDYVAYAAIVAGLNRSAELLGLDTSGERVAMRFNTHNGKATITKLDA